MQKIGSILCGSFLIALVIILMINIIDRDRTIDENPLTEKQVIGWGSNYIGYDTLVRNKKIKVAILDSGINREHEDLQKKVVKSFNAVNKTKPTQDDFGHGTNVAGIITANDNGVGIVGISQNVEIYDVKVLDSKGVGEVDVVVEGLRWALSNNVDIVNISFGFIKDYPELKKMINMLLSEHKIVIASAGNNIGGEVDFPARYAGVISVGSINVNGKIDALASEGKIDAYAPGSEIITTSRNGNYETVRGTSFSAAYVTGALAKVISSKEINEQNRKSIKEYLTENFSEINREAVLQ